MNPELLRMGMRNVGRNLRRSLITGVMVAIGVTAIVFFKAYVVGLQKLILDATIDSRNGALQVQREGYAQAQDLAPLNLDLPVDAGIEARLRGLPNVRDVAGRLRFVGLIARGDVSTAFLGLGVDPAREASVCPQGPAGAVRPGVAFGRISGGDLRSPDDRGVILARGLAANLAVKEGDVVTLLAQTRNGSTDAVDVTVRGIMSYSDRNEDNRMLAVPLGVAQRLLHMPGRISGYVVSVHDRDAIDATAGEARRALTEVTPRTEVRTWAAIDPYYADVGTLLDSILRLVMAIVFVVAIVGVVNTMMMAVFERRREIGTLMAVGFRRRDIMKLFLVEAAWLGLLSALGGVVLGAGLVAITARIGIVFPVPAVGNVLERPVLDVGYVLLAVGIALLGALAAGLYPAYRAARLRPIDALNAR